MTYAPRAYRYGLVISVPNEKDQIAGMLSGEQVGL